MKTLDTKNIIYNEHTSNKPLNGVVMAIVGALIISIMVIGLGLAVLAFAYWLVVKHPDMETVIWVCFCMGCAGVIQMLSCFLSNKRDSK